MECTGGQTPRSRIGETLALPSPCRYLRRSGRGRAGESIAQQLGALFVVRPAVGGVLA
ncbi:hypothetical protein [Streptomyces sp. N50]|uniref:hypothetical protein n=1 Tax=Streptomyces sp. N50 TaxID=3081765 RepID=UPI0029622CEE|nr:hypothetical protein [Streptomyces sp. N50]WOX13472.1 hypothetical protein R2B38_33640 [Streptomyces sp. N50]